jgi:alpha(1,3/1,4) fucosyltransferase
MDVRKPTIGFTNFWPGFNPEYFFPDPVSSLFERGSENVDVLVFSCFSGRTMAVPRIPPGKYIRVFYTHENIQPDFSSCDFAVSFSHDCDPQTHVRLPNYVSRFFLQEIDLQRFVQRRTDAEVDSIVADKRAFCAYVQRKSVPIREQIVRKLSAYKRVDCMGPHLNNVGGTLPMAEKHSKLREYKFTVAFENSSSPGYVTEKVVDAYVGGSIPLYWGDPVVERFFNPLSMLILSGDESGMVDFVERVAEVDRDDDTYRRILQEPLFKPEALRDHLDGFAVREFFKRIARQVPQFRERGGPTWSSPFDR